MAREVPIRSETIKLGQLLKLAGLIGSGSEAKDLLAGEAVHVNGEPEESSLARLAPPALRARFDGRDVTITADGERWASDAYTGSARRPLSTPLLILAALVLVVEALVARGSGERGSRGTVKAAA